MHVFLDKALNLIFPPKCEMCGKYDESYICKECLKFFQGMEQSVCKPIFDKNFEEHYWVFKYEDDIVRRKILELKFGEKAYLAKMFASIILSNQKTYMYLQQFDYIVPVPIHKKRYKFRGYNQTELICKEICKCMPELELLKDVLKKCKNTQAQSTMAMKNRMENVKDAFEVERKTDLCGKKILIFDDVYTTGNTVNECAKVLKFLGCEDICVMTIAKD